MLSSGQAGSKNVSGSKQISHLCLGLGFRLFFFPLKTPGHCHKCQELSSKLQLCIQGRIFKIQDSFWTLCPVCDGTPLPPLIPIVVAPVSCARQGKKGGLGKIWVWMRAQLCVVRPAFLLRWVCAFNEYMGFFVRGEMLTLPPELTVACMVTVCIKIKQKKKCIHMQLYLWNTHN